MLSWLFRNRVFLFLWATFTGFLFALVWKQYEQTIHQTLTYYRITPSSFDYQWAYRSWLSSQGLRSVPVLRKNETGVKDRKLVTEDQFLAERIPIACVVLSKKLKQTKAVKNTWAKHCNVALFYGPFNDDSIPVNKITTKDNWIFLCEVLSKVWAGYHEDFKWVLVVSDRTFALVENLRYMVAGLDHNESFYLGHTYRDYNGHYNVEDAGYVLSWGALSALSSKFPTKESCSHATTWHTGDRTLGKALEEQGIKPRDTRDIMERSRFLPFNLDKLLIPGAISVFSRYWRESVFLSPEGSGCCSDFVITFSDIPPDKMYMMEYIIYHLKPVSRTWPLVDDIGPPPQVATTVPNAKPKVKSTGKAFVSEITGKKTSPKKNEKGQGGEGKHKNVKTREIDSNRVLKPEKDGLMMSENRIVVNGPKKVASNEKTSAAEENLETMPNGTKSKIDKNNSLGRNGHTNPCIRESGIEMGVYDNTFHDCENNGKASEDEHDRDAKSGEKGTKKAAFDETLDKDSDEIEHLLQNTI